jgi:hypothetical protein
LGERGLSAVFLVKRVKRRQAGVEDFLLTEKEFVSRRMAITSSSLISSSPSPPSSTALMIASSCSFVITAQLSSLPLVWAWPWQPHQE